MVPALSGEATVTVMKSRHDNGLTLSYELEGDGGGLLQARVAFAGFAGEGSTWVAEGDLLAFAESVVKYPLDAAAAAVMLGHDEHPDDVTLQLLVRPVGGRGQLACRVRLASQASDYLQLGANRVIVEVLTTHERLSEFGRSLLNVASPLREAHLSVEVM